MGLAYLSVPLWVLALAFFLSLVAAREIGKWLHDRRRVEGPEEDPVALTSVLGLLALLIGFTFSIALSRYDARRELVVKEANAIGTTWLRMQLLDAPERARMEALLRQYVDARIAFGAARTSEAELREYARTAELQNRLWGALMQVVAPFRDTPRASLLITTTNESIDLAAERFATRQAHIPERILRILAVFALLAAGMVGYERGSQRKATTLLFVLLTLAITLVLDLDRPSSGATVVPQDPMLELKASMVPAATGTQGGSP
ncbi:hypothetical protein ACHZ97_09520 [Lysobacter soli]|uniref:bestrophin-like domain n=1 Tax=Lysobacter soli TaxID=453783 RepID=UPI0037C65680